MKKDKILFWSTTILIFLFEGVMSALTSHTEMAKDGITHLGYPGYFGTMLMVFKVLGSLALIIPAVPARVKEWAYAGFGIDFIAAFVSICVVDGLNGMAILPLVFMGVLAVSYTSYHKLSSEKK
ncbi:DoxX family protein [Patescibacteria group bacterium]|nr:DoxX family protein [Patescibacteria group bacterium]